MPKTKAETSKKESNSAKLGFEETLWQSADKLRGHLDAAEYKHVVLGLIFLKYISDAFDELYQQLEADEYADAEDRDEYLAENIFYVPQAARWQVFQDNARNTTIGTLIDEGMDAIEKENDALKGVLPKDYGKPSLDKRLLGELIDLISKIGLGDKESRSQEMVGRIYDYFLRQFAKLEGKKGDDFYTPYSVDWLLVKMVEPLKGRVYDPCCGSGNTLVLSAKYAEIYGGNSAKISIYGQESNLTTWKLCRMNLAIRGIDGNLGAKNADSFRNDLHKDLKADYIFAGIPFNMSDWGGQHLREDSRWIYGTPPVGNANYAWIQHIISHLAPNGIAGFVLANGSMSSNQSGEGEIRKALIEGDLVDCMVALPGQLFYNTQIPACLWFLTRNKGQSPLSPLTPLKKGGTGMRQRKGETLFIDARKLGVLIDRVHRELTAEEIKRIADTYHAWRSDKGNYEDIAGFCKGATLEEIRGHGYVLTPGRYVGAEETDDDDEPFAEKMERLTQVLQGQFAESAQLEAEIKLNLRGLGYEA